MGERWTWHASAQSDIVSAFAGPDWCDRLEQAGPDALTGKVLCVCAAVGVARKVMQSNDEPAASEALNLLAHWIDEPTRERFDRICDTIFGPEEPPELGPHGVVWWALRAATSSVGNKEAGWALSTVCSAAEASGFSPEMSRLAAERAVLARRQDAEHG